MRMMGVGLMVLGLTACAGANGAGPGEAPAVAEGPCRNDGLDSFVGQKASAEVGAVSLQTFRSWRRPAAAATSTR